MKVVECFQGDSSSVLAVAPKSSTTPIDLDSNWVCQTAVVNCSNTVVVSPRSAATKDVANNNFLVGLTAAETASLSVPANEPYETYYWVVEISNAVLVPPYVVEERIELRIKPQGIV